jgi:hypothetical protein
MPFGVFIYKRERKKKKKKKKNLLVVFEFTAQLRPPHQNKFVIAPKTELAAPPTASPTPESATAPNADPAPCAT